MKRLITILTLVFTMMFSSTSYAEWTKAGAGGDGSNFYIDYDRVRKHGGYVYWWDLSDLLKPDKDGDLSYISYVQGDCGAFRYKTLSEWYYKQNMGRGTPTTNTVQNPQWKYPTPKSISETLLEKVCSR